MIDTDLTVIQPFFVAQGDGAPVLGGNGTTTEPGGGNGGGGSGGGGGDPFGGMSMILIIMVLFIIMIFWSSSSQRKERKKKEAMIGAMRKHDEVQTIGGVIGSVVDIRGDRVILKVDESSNTRMTFSKASIQQVLRQRGQTSKESTEEGEETKD